MDNMQADIFIFVIVMLIIILLIWIYLDHSQNADIKAELRNRAIKENAIEASPKYDYNSPISRNSGIAKISNNPQSSVYSMGQLGTEKDVVMHRILAVIIDYFVLGFSLFFLSFAIGASIVPKSSIPMVNGIMALFIGLYSILIALILIIILWIPYAIILETWRGQTIGKMILGIVVVKENGDSCTFAAALLRNVLRIIDALPQSYLVGFIFMALSEKRQRIGDRLANTIVVRIKR